MTKCSWSNDVYCDTGFLGEQSATRSVFCETEPRTAVTMNFNFGISGIMLRIFTNF